jgi:hypothetical protein
MVSPIQYECWIESQPNTTFDVFDPNARMVVIYDQAVGLTPIGQRERVFEWEIVFIFITHRFFLSVLRSEVLVALSGIYWLDLRQRQYLRAPVKHLRR